MHAPNILLKQNRSPVIKRNLKIIKRKIAARPNPAKKARRKTDIAAVIATTNPATVRPILQWGFLYSLRSKQKAILQMQKSKNSDSKKPTILQAIPLSGYRLK